MNSQSNYRRNTSAKKTSNNTNAYIEFRNIGKSAKLESGTVDILNNINFKINRGEYLGVVGKSGSGKSTLLNILSAIDRPTCGEIVVDGYKINNLNEDKAAVWRGSNIGIIFQFFQLLPTISVLDNIMLPMDFNNSTPPGERRDLALTFLTQVDMIAHANKLPTTLSGGEQQRVAIARSLANNPPIIIADEPTGNLDSITSKAIHGLFGELAASGKTVIMVTHEKTENLLFSRIMTLSDGEIVDDQQRRPTC